jgi:hypothetical protein
MDPDRGEEALELLRNLLEKHLEVHGGCTIERPVQEVRVSFPVVPQTRLSWWKRAINWLNT